MKWLQPWGSWTPSIKRDHKVFFVSFLFFVFNLIFFGKKLGKGKRRKFSSMQIFNFYKNHIHAEMCAVELYMTISCAYDCYYLNLVLRWFNITNPFYFNLSEVFFNLDQERKLHAINCVLFFAKAFISSLNSE